MIRPGAELDALGVAQNCDKSSAGRVKDGVRLPAHDFLRKYAMFLERFRHQPDLRLMELGIGPDWNMGASLRVWEGYFPQPGARFTMVDNNPAARRFDGGRVSVRVGDLGEAAFLAGLAKEPQDVILDDASHQWAHQIGAFRALFGALRPGGVYIVEDIHTSFGPGRRRFGAEGRQDAFDFLTRLTALVAGKGAAHPLLEGVPERAALEALAREVESVTVIAEACILCKAGYY